MKKMVLVLIVILFNFNIKEYYNSIIYSSSVIMEVEIPSIDLNKKIFNFDSILNDVDKNLFLIEESKLPNVKGSSLIIASHSGNSKYAYFNNLDNVMIGDEIIIYYNNVKYIYIVSDIYDINKNGYFRYANSSENIIYLITCRDDDRYQLVVKGVLIYEIM